MVSKAFLEIVVCPERLVPLELAEERLVERLNEAIEAGRLRNKGGGLVERHLDGGLVARQCEENSTPSDRAVLYPIIDGIPILLVDEAIALDQLEPLPGEG